MKSIVAVADDAVDTSIDVAPTDFHCFDAEYFAMLVHAACLILLLMMPLPLLKVTGTRRHRRRYAYTGADYLRICLMPDMPRALRGIP